MTTYRIAFEELYEVYIDAKDEDEAREKFVEGAYSDTNSLGINIIDIQQDEEIIGQDEGGFYTDNGYVPDEVALGQGYAKEIE